MNTRTQLLEELFDVMGALMRQMTPSRERWLVELGLSRQQFHTLHAIERLQPITVGDLAGALDITSGAATQMIDNLVEKGLLTRQTDTHDRRVIYVQLSDHGRQIATEIKAAHAQFLTTILEPLSVVELRDLISLITKVNHHVGSGPHSAPTADDQLVA